MGFILEFDTDAAALHRTRNRLGDDGDVEATTVLDHAKLAAMVRTIADEIEAGDTAGAVRIPGLMVGGALPRVGVWAIADDAHDPTDVPVPDVTCRYCEDVLFPGGNGSWVTVSPQQRRKGQTDSGTCLARLEDDRSGATSHVPGGA